MARKIIIDTDPGQDDAVAILLALASPELKVLGLTAVAGNVPMDQIQRNARMICQIAGRPDIPVHAGCDRPMVRKLVTAEHVHGNTGLDGIEIFQPDTPLAQGHAVDFIIDTLRAERGRRKETADRLGISARTLRYKLAQMRDAGVDVEALLYAS